LDLAVVEAGGDGAGEAGLGAALVRRVAAVGRIALRLAEVLPEEAVGVDDSIVPVLHRDVAGGLLEEHVPGRLALRQLTLQFVGRLLRLAQQRADHLALR
jgi:hypothetical protein